mgnify:CR=1 FL=1
MSLKNLLSWGLGIAAFLISLLLYSPNSFGFGFIGFLITAIPYWTAKTVADGGPLAIFLLMSLESSSLPIPSEVILPLSGFLIAQGKLSLLSVLAASSAGSILGSLADYYIGLLIGLEGLEKRRWISEQSLKKATEWFKAYGPYAVFFTRMLPGMRTLVSFPAGAFRMNVYKFVLFTFLGSFLWSLILIYFGILLESNWELAIKIINRFLVPAAIGVAVGFFVYIILSLLTHSQP